MAELLKIENLTKKYDNQVILDGINLSIQKGEVLVLVGPSGCGKSTLLRCINGLEAIQGGTVKLEGQEVKSGDKNLPLIRQKIGMVFQSYELFPHLNVIDNLLLAPTMSQRIDTMFVFVLCGIFMPENADFTGFSGCFIVCCECRKFRRALISFFETPILLSIAAVPPTNR